MITIDDFTNLLDQKEILKIEEPIWNLFQIYHGIECLDHYGMQEYPQIRGALKNIFNSKLKLAGVYAYYLNDHCIYIGISKDLSERAYQHLLESCNIWGHDRYKKTFSTHVGLINLYFLPLGD